MNKAIAEITGSMTLDLHPSLDEVVQTNGLNRERLTVPVRMERTLKVGEECGSIFISDGDNIAVWPVPSLRVLFRGHAIPPPMRDGPPPDYMPLFIFIEHHALCFCDAFGDKTDSEFEEAYQQLRRRPDGIARSELHLFFWQVAALLAGRWPISAEQFEVIFGRLSKSASTFRTAMVSRNYISTIRKVLR